MRSPECLLLTVAQKSFKCISVTAMLGTEQSVLKVGSSKNFVPTDHDHYDSAE